MRHLSVLVFAHHGLYLRLTSSSQSRFPTCLNTLRPATLVRPLFIYLRLPTPSSIFLVILRYPGMVIVSRPYPVIFLSVLFVARP